MHPLKILSEKYTNQVVESEDLKYYDVINAICLILRTNGVNTIQCINAGDLWKEHYKIAARDLEPEKDYEIRNNMTHSIREITKSQEYSEGERWVYNTYFYLKDGEIGWDDFGKLLWTKDSKDLVVKVLPQFDEAFTKWRSIILQANQDSGINTDF